MPPAQRDVCDLIGSTALSAQLDPANLREVIRSYQARIANTIQLFDGFLVRGRPHPLRLARKRVRPMPNGRVGASPWPPRSAQRQSAS
jgi:hypothetical protein